MPVGAYYIDDRDLKEFEAKLRATAGSVRDIKRVYGTIGRKAAQYVTVHEPIYAGSSKDSSTHPPPGFMQSRTRGGGGQTAWVAISGVPYIYVQEFGGKSYWHRAGRGALRGVNRGHRAITSLGGGLIGVGRFATKGHIIYHKPRRTRGYFIWNVAFRLRHFIGRTLTEGISEIGARHGIQIDITDTNLNIPETDWNGRP